MKYPRIKYPEEMKMDVLGHPDDIIVVEEKIDGANFRFWKDEDGDLAVGSRNVDLGKAETVGGRWGLVVKYLLDTVAMSEVRDGYVYFGEATIPHTIKYDRNKIPPIVMFDVWNGEHWLSFSEKAYVVSAVGLEVVPILWKGLAGEIDLKAMYEPFESRWGPEAEGRVIKNYYRGTMMKIVLKEYQERSKAKARKPTGDDINYFLDKYASEWYIQGIVYKVMDDGHEIGMGMMKVLPKAVWRDIVIEKGSRILGENKVLDLKRFRSAIAKRCLKVIREMMG